MFDTEKFISEVEARPLLYDSTCEGYSDKDLKAKCWYEVGNAMHSDWKKLDANEKDKRAKELGKKWKAVRDCFVKDYKHKRSLVEDSTPEGNKKKGYVYYDQLQFLLPFVKCRQNMSPNFINPGFTDNNNARNTRGKIPTRNNEDSSAGKSSSPSTAENNSNPVKRCSQRKGSDNRNEHNNRERSVPSSTENQTDVLDKSSENSSPTICKKELEATNEFKSGVEALERSAALKVEEKMNGFHPKLENNSSSTAGCSNNNQFGNPIDNDSKKDVLPISTASPTDERNNFSTPARRSFKRELERPNEFDRKRFALEMPVPVAKEEQTNVGILNLELQKQEIDSDKYGHKSFLLSFVPALYNLPFDTSMQIRSQISSIFATQFGRTD